MTGDDAPVTGTTTSSASEMAQTAAEALGVAEHLLSDLADPFQLASADQDDPWAALEFDVDVDHMAPLLREPRHIMLRDKISFMVGSIMVW